MELSLKNHPLLSGKRAGVLFPLFSLRSKKDWGIGEVADMAGWAEWMSGMGLGVLGLLPVNEMQPGGNCPYTGLSAFALDPIYISVSEMEDARESKDVRRQLASKEFRCALKAWRKSRTVLYEPIRYSKYKVLWNAFQHFLAAHWKTNSRPSLELSGSRSPSPEAEGSPRAGQFRSFMEANHYWLDDYAVFRALKDANGWKSWTQWEPGLRSHEPHALEAFTRANEDQVLFFKYLQWVLDVQWRRAKENAAGKGVLIYGDLPFMVNQESPDVWSRQGEFDLSCSVGAPPDQFSADGQRWGIPACRWNEMEASGFWWWRARMRRARRIYDLIRLDHVVGFFRTWTVPHDKSVKPDFDISQERLQRERGERFLKMILEESGQALPVAEDLGMIPPFVRKTLASVSVPGYKVMRWEKDSDVFRDPAGYQRVSLATTGTHDTDTLARWWDTMDAAEKKALWRMVSGRDNAPRSPAAAHEGILRRVMNSGSALVVLPVQDIFGLQERINTPGTTGEHNWTFRFPVTAEEIGKDARFKKRTDFFRRTAAESGRLLPLLSLLLLLLFSGCSVRRMAVRSTAQIIESGMSAYFEENDLELAREAMSSNLKLLEVLLKNEPGNIGLLEALSQGYCGYSFMFIEDDSPGRAALFYKRGAGYAMKALEEKGLAKGNSVFYEKAGASDAPSLFWTAFCNISWIGLNKDDPDALAGLVRVVPVAERVLELDPGYYNNGAHAICGVYYAGRPRMLGGDPARAKKHFDASLEGAGNSFQMNRLMYAKSYAVAVQDRGLFEKLLKDVLNGRDLVPGQRLANEAAKKKAKKLLEQINELF